MSLTTQPKNFNLLSPLGYKFILSRAPNIEYFVQQISLPDMSISPIQVPTPFVKMYESGEHIDFGSLSLTFKINEDLDNYMEIYNWLIALGTPESFDQYTLSNNRSSLIGQNNKQSVRSDITVTLLTSGLNPNVEFHMKDCFPTSISSILLDSTSSDIVYLDATVDFSVRNFTVSKITS